MLTFKVGDELTVRFGGADREDDSFQAMDCVDLQVDLLGLHFLFQEGEGVYVFDHFGIGYGVRVGFHNTKLKKIRRVLDFAVRP